MSKSEDDLKEAFAGESQANRKYLAFAAAADKEGMPQIAKLFRAAAHAETIHAHAHLRVLGGVLDTSANLNNAITGENYEVVSMYPRMIRDAEEEGNAAATKSFRRAFEVEKSMKDYSGLHWLLWAKSKKSLITMFARSVDTQQKAVHRKGVRCAAQNVNNSSASHKTIAPGNRGDLLVIRLLTLAVHSGYPVASFSLGFVKGTICTFQQFVQLKRLAFATGNTEAGCDGEVDFLGYHICVLKL